MLRALGENLSRSLLTRPRGACSSSAFSLQSQQLLQRRLFGVEAPPGVDEQYVSGQQHTPTVFDRLVTINVVDLAGKRRRVSGLVGQSLAQVLAEAGYPRVRASSYCMHHHAHAVGTEFSGCLLLLRRRTFFPTWASTRSTSWVIGCYC